MNRLATSLLLAAALALAGTASAQPAPAGGVTTFALVIGSNAGGPGQATLHYAEEDAKRVGSLLVELGGYTSDHVDTVLSPTPDDLRKHLDALTKRVAAESAAGRRSRVTFYYSGHARATALDLGSAQMPLAELRTRLFASTAQVTVVVLDACQSGAFSHVKGGAPAADFSYNSKSQLDATGVAVLASSTGSELSQESEELRGSYFTHNLLTGMRGPGDANGDGQVSIDEAYRYAYHQTLLATAETAVGGQHVTFEVDLKGHGEVPMSFPRAATASLLLPAGFDGSTIIENTKAKTVIAELYKAKADAIRIAVPPGEYDVLVRQGTELARCHVMTPTTGTATIDITRCLREKVVAVATKGSDDPPSVRAFFEHQSRANEWWNRIGHNRIELGLSLGGDRKDDYVQELNDFQYYEQGDKPPTLTLTALHQPTFSPMLWVGGTFAYSDSSDWRRTDVLSSAVFHWTTAAAMLDAQLLRPLPFSGRWGHFAVYLEVGIGVAVTRSKLTKMTTDDSSTTEWFGGLGGTMGAGFKYQSSLLGGLGFSAGAEYLILDGLKNLDGEQHNSGGAHARLGVFYAF